MSIVSEISSANKSGHAVGILYAGLIGLAVSDIVPTIADSVYFNYQYKLKKQLNEGAITPKQYWTKDAVSYYTFNPIWWTLVLAATVAIPGGASNKMKLALGLIGAGAVFSVIHKNIVKDQQLKDETKRNNRSNEQ